MLLSLAIFLTGILLRGYQYAQFPVAGETQDEVAWTLLGSSLLQTGQPTSWSHFAPYTQTETVHWAQSEFRLVTPVVDHPPLFSLLPGGVVTLADQPWKQLPSMRLIRFPMVLLGTLNLALFFWWLHRLPISPLWRATSGLIFATAPSWVFISRLVVSENLIHTWILTLLLLASWQPRSSRLRSLHWVLTVLIHAALPLTKISGLAIAVASTVLWWRASSEPSSIRWRAAWTAPLIGTICGVAALTAYMAWFNWELFVTIQTQQSQRGVGLLTLYTSQLLNWAIVNKPFADAWNFLGLVTLFGWILNTPRSKALLFWHRYTSGIALAVLAFIALSVGEFTLHAWYRVPLIPLMALSLGWVADTLWRERNWLGISMTWLLLGVSLRTGLYSWFGYGFLKHQELWQRAWTVIAGGWACGALFSLPPRSERWLLTGVFCLAATTVLLGHVMTITHTNAVNYWEDAQYLISGE